MVEILQDSRFDQIIRDCSSSPDIDKSLAEKRDQLLRQYFGYVQGLLEPSLAEPAVSTIPEHESVPTIPNRTRPRRLSRSSARLPSVDSIE